MLADGGGCPATVGALQRRRGGGSAYEGGARVRRHR